MNKNNSFRRYYPKSWGIVLIFCLFLGLCTAIYWQPSLINNTKSVESNDSLAKIFLGRELFFDKKLSANSKVACATCHQPEKAFADGLPLSNLGVSGKKLLRHTPTLFYLEAMPAYFWDGGAKDLPSQAVAPLRHPDEMGKDLKLLVQELQNSSHYLPLFKNVFATDSLQTIHVLQALAAYQRTIRPRKTVYDDWKTSPPNPLSIWRGGVPPFLLSLSIWREKNTPPLHLERETGGEVDTLLAGFKVFAVHCEPCHRLPLFTDNRFHNNGLATEIQSTVHEQVYWGRGRITQKSADKAKYKTPTLRNIVYSAPYMHDGRFSTLEEVLKHYTTGVQPSSTLDSLLVKNGRQGIYLTAQEKKDLLRFLRAL
jgi:cytochrome c peroxidase